MCATAKAAEGICELVIAKAGWQDETVVSNAAVLAQFHAAETTLTRVDLPWLMTFKCDFVNFFLNASRFAVLRATRWWTTQVRTWFPGRPFVRVRKERFRAMHRELAMPGQASLDVQLARTEGDAEWDSVRVDAIPGFLEEDTHGLMVFAGEVMMQSKGLAIGSPWGGSGCRLWCTFQAHRARHLRIWAQRPDGCTLIGRAHSQNGAVSGLRWVDDRWRVARGSSLAMLRRIYAVDLLTYTELWLVRPCPVGGGAGQ